MEDNSMRRRRRKGVMRKEDGHRGRGERERERYSQPASQTDSCRQIGRQTETETHRELEIVCWLVA